MWLSLQAWQSSRPEFFASLKTRGSGAYLVSMIGAKLILFPALAAFAIACSAQTVATNTNTNIPMVIVRLLDDKGQPGPVVSTPKVIKTDAEWRKQLTEEPISASPCNKGTEPAFCGVFYDQHKPGIYYCICCGLPLFTSEAKFKFRHGLAQLFPTGRARKCRDSRR